MKESNLIIKSALAGVIAMGIIGISQSAVAGDMQAAAKMEKCYGVNAANKNDCASPGHSCAGQDTKARDPNAFVAVPAGLCSKIEGGQTTPAKKM